MRFDMGEMLWIAVIAFVGVWLIDKALHMGGLQQYSINSPTSGG